MFCICIFLYILAGIAMGCFLVAMYYLLETIKYDLKDRKNEYEQRWKK